MKNSLTLRGFDKPVKLDPQSLVDDVILRKSTPKRVFFMELFLDAEINDAVDQRFGLTKDLDRNDPFYAQRRQIAISRFLGYDYVRAEIEGFDLNFYWDRTADTAGENAHVDGRGWVNEHVGPVASWEDFEKYPWPDPKNFRTDKLEWFEKNLPDDMCLFGRAGGHWCEHLCWLFGYERLCFALYDDRDLVLAVRQKLEEYELIIAKLLMGFPRITCMWASDDMGFKTGPMIAPPDLRELVLSGHKQLAAMWHASGRPYILHCCGNRSTFLEDLIEDVKLDGVHSFEDTIEEITDAKRAYGKRLSLLGGIDVDFLCRASEAEIRARVRRTIECCQPGGGFALGTGNTVANYIPLENYLIMMDEGRLYAEQ